MLKFYVQCETAKIWRKRAAETEEEKQERIGEKYKENKKAAEIEEEKLEMEEKQERSLKLGLHFSHTLVGHKKKLTMGFPLATCLLLLSGMYLGGGAGGILFPPPPPPCVNLAPLKINKLIFFQCSP